MAATIAMLTRLSQPGVYDRMARSGIRLMDGLRAAFRDAGLPAAVTVTGFPQIFYVGLGLATPPINYRGTLIDRMGYRRFTTALLERGVRALERGSWFMSTEHDEDVVDETIAAIVPAIEAVKPQSGL